MSETDQTLEQDVQFSPGSLLKQARERAGISIEDVVQKLKLTRQTVISIESDDYSADLPATFYRGYLRNYAELLKLDDDDIVENFDNFCKRNNLFTQNEQSLATIELEKPLTSSNWMIKTVTTLLILLVLLGLYYLLVEKKIWQQFTSSTPSISEQKTILTLGQNEEGDLLLSEPATSDSANDLADSADLQEQTTVSEDDISELAPAEESAVATLPEGTSNIASDSTKSGAGGDLVLVFSDDCWVRITDANGKVLALGIKQGGTSISLSGPTPIELTLGKPSAVQLSYQNEPVDLSSYPDTRAARLTLGN
ncbi:MAG TPA: RodZ domain-containing protein [Kangiella sp.]|uniref:RodZ domain-containing protein n=1 Tax=Kangiella sp. TaxID=1920245 RepID=UPI002F94938C